ARLKPPPASTATIADSSETWTGALPVTLLNVQTVPSAFSAIVWQSPAAIAFTPLKLATWTAVRTDAPPHGPEAPHVQSVPLLLRAALCVSPAATAVTSVKPLTGTGVDASFVVPSPSLPLVLLPHAHTVPSVLTARLWLKRPASTDLTPLSGTRMRL